MTARVALLTPLIVLVACGDATRPPAKPMETPRARAERHLGEREPDRRRPALEFALYEPGSLEDYRNGKRLAGRVAQALATYDRGTTPAKLVAALDGARGKARLTRIVAPMVEPDKRSAGQVVYVQLSGVTTSSLGGMVVVRQHLEDRAGRRTRVTRVIDVRLRRDGGPWRLERIGSVGGSPVKRPADLPEAAVRVVDHPNITLPDTARWDIYRGWVDGSLLRRLADVADERRISIAVLRTGHPPSVWGTRRASAHRAGNAADIYAVSGRLVVRQRAVGSSAYRLARRLIADGARQVGSPWILPPGGRRSFTDEVHQDHIHLQQSAVD